MATTNETKPTSPKSVASRPASSRSEDGDGLKALVGIVLGVAAVFFGRKVYDRVLAATGARPAPLPQGRTPAVQSPEPSPPVQAPSVPRATEVAWTPATVPQGVAKAFTSLLGQIRARWPERKPGLDGRLPSDAHRLANPTSDHDKGNALDVNYDTTANLDMDALAEALLKDPRTSYVIWNRRIANPSIQAGAWRPYLLTKVQTDPHTGHVHLSVLAAKRDDASAWDLSSVPDKKAVA